MEKFKYFKLSFEKPHSDIKTFHQFCVAKKYYYSGYTNTFGYACPRCWGNGSSQCKYCKGRGKVVDRSPIIREYMRYRREYRKIIKLWEKLYAKWLGVVGKLAEEDIELLETFGLYK